jgi:hypothetical protein
MSGFGRFSKISLGDSQFNSLVYKTRQTGRTGNELAEYFFWYLRALKHGKNFECTYEGEFPFPFNKLPKTQKNPLKKWIIPTPVESYPLSMKYYYKHRDFIKVLLKNEKVHEKTDIVIHVRLDDIMNNMCEYTLLPSSYYMNILEKLPFFRTVKIVARCKNGQSKSQVHEDIIQKYLLDYLKEIIEHSFQFCTVDICNTDDISKDYETIMQAETFIGSTSYFWTWPIFVSDNIKKVYYPDFGVIKKFDLYKFNHCETIKVKVPFKNKITDYEKFFDYKI